MEAHRHVTGLQHDDGVPRARLRQERREVQVWQLRARHGTHQPTFSLAVTESLSGALLHKVVQCDATRLHGLRSRFAKPYVKCV